MHSIRGMQIGCSCGICGGRPRPWLTLGGRALQDRQCESCSGCRGGGRVENPPSQRLPSRVSGDWLCMLRCKVQVDRLS